MVSDRDRSVKILHDPVNKLVPVSSPFFNDAAKISRF